MYCTPPFQQGLIEGHEDQVRPKVLVIQKYITVPAQGNSKSGKVDKTFLNKLQMCVNC